MAFQVSLRSEFSMRKILRALLALTVWTVCTGVHWDVVQVFAWAKMFSSNIEELSYREAMVRTFDPAEKCGICHVVAKAKEDEQSNSGIAIQVNEKAPLIVFNAKPIVFSSPEVGFSRELESYRRWTGRATRAPTPPPRIG